MPETHLTETLRYDPHSGPVRGVMHLRRLADRARARAIPFDMMHAASRLDGLYVEGPARVVLRLSADGRMGIEASPFRAPERMVFRIGEVGGPAVDEVLLTDSAGNLTIGQLTHVFVDTGDGLVTPQLGPGHRTGILRQDLIERGRAQEARLRPGDLVEGRVFLGNSLLGLVPARRLRG